jgi:hypothetical protein
MPVVQLTSLFPTTQMYWLYGSYSTKPTMKLAGAHFPPLRYVGYAAVTRFGPQFSRSQPVILELSGVHEVF